MSVTDKINLAIAVTAGLSAVIAAAYTFFTAKILSANRDAVSAMRAQVQELSRPRVLIWPWVRLGTQMFCLTVKNGGSSSAESVRLTVDQDFYVFGEKRADRNLRVFSAFSQPIEALAPGAEMIFYLGVSHQMFGAKSDGTMPLLFTVRAEYSFGGQKYSETTNIDLRPFLESAVPQDPIADAIEKLTKEAKEMKNEVRSIRQALADSNKRLQATGSKQPAPEA